MINKMKEKKYQKNERYRETSKYRKEYETISHRIINICNNVNTNLSS